LAEVFKQGVCLSERKAAADKAARTMFKLNPAIISPLPEAGMA
jgi:hypothetical protein